MNKFNDPTFSNQLPRGIPENIIVPIVSKNLAIVIYDIREVGMSNDIGLLAIVDKANGSKSVLRSEALYVEAWSPESIVISRDEEYALFRRGICSPEESIKDYSFFIMRLSDFSFGFFKMKDAWKYRPIEQDDLKFELREQAIGDVVADKVGGEINIKAIKFYPRSEIDRWFDIYISEKLD